MLKTDLFKIYLDRIQRLDRDVIQSASMSGFIFRAYNLGIYTERLHALRDEVNLESFIDDLPKESLLDFLDGIEETIETTMDGLREVEI